MDADTLRIILIVFGALVLAGLYVWERRKHGSEDYDDDDDDDREGSKREPRLGPWHEQPTETEEAALTQPAPGRGGKDASVPENQTDIAASSAGSQASMPEPAGGPLILTLHISTSDQPFGGAAIVHAASRCGLEPGEMDIYHCVLGEGLDRQVLFSMANMVKPGTFPFGAMADFSTPGLTLFAQLDGTADDPGRLEEMLGTAHSLASDLGGEVRDQDRNRLTPDFEQRLRRRVMDFVGARLAAAESK